MEIDPPSPLQMCKFSQLILANFVAVLRFPLQQKENKALGTSNSITLKCYPLLL